MTTTGGALEAVAATVAPSTPLDRRSPIRGWWLPEWRRLVAGLLAGALLAGSMPPRQAWYLAPAGAAVLTWALLGLPWRQRLALGATAGLAFFAPTLGWLRDRADRGVSVAQDRHEPR